MSSLQQIIQTEDDSKVTMEEILQMCMKSEMLTQQVNIEQIIKDSL